MIERRRESLTLEALGSLVVRLEDVQAARKARSWSAKAGDYSVPIVPWLRSNVPRSLQESTWGRAAR